MTRTARWPPWLYHIRLTTDLILETRPEQEGRAEPRSVL